MLLLWLSIVCMVPFDMVKLDSNARDESGQIRKPIMERIIDAGQRYSILYPLLINIVYENNTCTI